MCGPPATSALFVFAKPSDVNVIRSLVTSEVDFTVMALP